MNKAQIAILKEAVAVAARQVQEAVRRLAQTRIGDSLQQLEAARSRLMTAERNLAEAEGRAYALRQDCALRWDTGAPLPTLLQSDHRTLLFFWLSKEDAVGRVEFDGCCATSFGAPGDETFVGHPLYGSGFEPYEAMQVMNSPWVEQLRKIDSSHRNHNPRKYANLKHFIFAFHDTTFECVARSFRASDLTGSLRDAVMEGVNEVL